MKEKQKVRLKGQLRLYMQWPAIMATLLIGMNIWIYKLDKKAGGVMSLFLLLYIVMVGVLYLYTKSLVVKDLVQFAAQYGIIQNTLLKELAVPYALLLEDGKTIWMNDQFEKILGGIPRVMHISASSFRNSISLFFLQRQMMLYRWMYILKTKSIRLSSGKCRFQALVRRNS